MNKFTLDLRINANVLWIIKSDVKNGKTQSKEDVIIAQNAAGGFNDAYIQQLQNHLTTGNILMLFIVLCTLHNISNPSKMPFEMDSPGVPAEQKQRFVLSAFHPNHPPVDENKV